MAQKSLTIKKEWKYEDTEHRGNVFPPKRIITGYRITLSTITNAWPETQELVFNDPETFRQFCVVLEQFNQWDHPDEPDNSITTVIGTKA